MPDTYSVLFLGTSAFAVPALKALASHPKFDVQLVITQPDKPAGRKKLLTPSPVKIAAEELGLPIEQPEKINIGFVETQNFASLPKPDYLVCVSYGQILSQAILDLPKIVPVNVHPSLLPELRGATPLQHAILQGKTQSGVTIQAMAKDMDAGPILSQTIVQLDERETFTSLHDRLATLGAELLIKTLLQPLTPVDQQHADATFCQKLQKSDGMVDTTTMTAISIDRMIRALSPWPGVTWKETKLLEASLNKAENSFALPCAENTTLHVHQILPAGGKPMSGAAFLRGHPTLLS